MNRCTEAKRAYQLLKEHRYDNVIDIIYMIYWLDNHSEDDFDKLTEAEKDNLINKTCECYQSTYKDIYDITEAIIKYKDRLNDENFDIYDYID